MDCTDWLLCPLFPGVALLPAVKEPPRLPMGEGALVLAGLTYLLSLGKALTTTNPAVSPHHVAEKGSNAPVLYALLLWDTCWLLCRCQEKPVLHNLRMQMCSSGAWLHPPVSKLCM